MTAPTTNLDLYPGQPTKDALQWSLDFCLRNVPKRGFGENFLISLAFDYYRAVLLAENRYNTLIAEFQGIDPVKVKPLKLREFFHEAKRIIKENEDAI